MWGTRIEDGSIQRLRWILRISLIFGTSVLAIASWWYYKSHREALESSILTELSAIADVKAKQIANWRSERIGDGNVLLSAAVSGRARRLLAAGTSSESDRGELRDVLQRFIAAFHYAGAALVDQTGGSRLEINRRHGDPERYRTFEAHAVESGGVFLSDLYPDRTTNMPWMLLTVPLGNAGAMILDIDPSSFLYPYVGSWPTASRSGETILVRPEGADLILVSEGKDTRSASLWKRRTWAGPLSAEEVRGSLHQWTDYRGVPVAGVIKEITGSNWSLLAKLDVDEAYAPLHRLRWGMAAVVGMIFLTNVAGAALIWRNRLAHIYRERESWFRQISNDTPAYLWMTLPGVESFFINVRCARFFGTSEDHLDRLLENYVHPDDTKRARAEHAACVEGRSEYCDEIRLRRFDGTYRWMAVQGLPRYSQEGAFAGYAGAFTDVNERREAAENLRRANQELASELNERTRSEHQVQALSARLINAQEEERARLARELHDDLSQQIAAVSIATGNLKKRIPGESVEAMEQCSRIQRKLVSLAASIRRMSHELHPAVLQYAGLAGALRNYCSELSTLTAHRIDFREEGSFYSLPQAVALCVYRVAQEALQNSVKHARADKAEVVLTCSGGVLDLVVSDHGIGMGPDAAAGLGLISIRERARLVDGIVEVKAKLGEGVTINLRVSLPASEATSAAKV